MKNAFAAILLSVFTFLVAYSQQVVRETVAPTGSPSAGYSICWIDSGTHVLNCRNSSGAVFQPTQLEASGQLRVSFPGVSVLPPASSGSIRGVYVFTGASAQNQCPLSGLGGSGGSYTALCWTDGSLWHSIPVANSNGDIEVSFPGLAVLPTVSSGTVHGAYRFTRSSGANQCLQAGDSGGTALSLCLSDGTNWHSIPLTDIDGSLALPGSITPGSCTFSTLPTASGAKCYCADCDPPTVIGAANVCTHESGGGAVATGYGGASYCAVN